MSEAVKSARNQQLGIFQIDAINAGFAASSWKTITTDHAILHKLFRRLSEYMVNYGSAVGFKQKMVQSKEPVLDQSKRSTSAIQVFYGFHFYFPPKTTVVERCRVSFLPGQNAGYHLNNGESTVCSRVLPSLCQDRTCDSRFLVPKHQDVPCDPDRWVVKCQDRTCDVDFLHEYTEDRRYLAYIKEVSALWRMYGCWHILNLEKPYICHN